MMTTNGLGSSYLFVVVAGTTQRSTCMTLNGSFRTRSGGLTQRKMIYLPHGEAFPDVFLTYSPI